MSSRGKREGFPEEASPADPGGEVSQEVVCSVPSGLCLQYHVISPLLSFQPCSPLYLGFSPWCFASFLLLWKGNR